MRKRSHKTTKVVVTRRIFGARSVPKCVCRRGCAPDPTVEKLHTLLTPSSAVPCRKSRPIYLLVVPPVWLAAFLVNKRNVAYFNIAWSFQSYVYLIGLFTISKVLSKVDMYAKFTKWIKMYSTKSDTVHALTVALTVLSPAVGHGHGGQRPPRLPTTFFLFHFGVNLTANYQGINA